jgi:hypothetical protein
MRPILTASTLQVSELIYQSSLGRWRALQIFSAAIDRRAAGGAHTAKLYDWARQWLDFDEMEGIGL